MYLKQTMSLQYTVLQLFSVTCCNVIWHVKHVLYLYISTSHSLCAVPNMAAVRSSLNSYFIIINIIYVMFVAAGFVSLVALLFNLISKKFVLLFFLDFRIRWAPQGAGAAAEAFRPDSH